MAKPEWGRKHLCQSCGAKFYDLRRDPPTCPSCGTQIDLSQPGRSRRGGLRGAAAASAAKSAAAAAPAEPAAEAAEEAPLAEGAEVAPEAEEAPIAEDGEAAPKAEEGESDEVAEISALEGDDESIANSLPDEDEGEQG